MVSAVRSNRASFGSVSVTEPLTDWSSTESSAPSDCGDGVDRAVHGLGLERSPHAAGLDRPVDALEAQAAVEVPDPDAAVDGVELRRDAGRHGQRVVRHDAAARAGRGPAAVAAAVHTGPAGLERPAVLVVALGDAGVAKKVFGLLRRRRRDRHGHDRRELGPRRGDDLARDVLDRERLPGGERSGDALGSRRRALLGLPGRNEHQEQSEGEQDPDGQTVGARRRRLAILAAWFELQRVHRQRETLARHGSFAGPFLRRRSP